MSRYEKRFGVKKRGRGRPVGVGADMVVFSFEGKETELAKHARQRALALIMDENRDRLRTLFEDEYRWLAKEAAKNRHPSNGSGSGSRSAGGVVTQLRRRKRDG